MLTDDYELSREDIQGLSSRDALAAFFARLGYDTNARLVQNAAAMGFSSDLLKSSITHIERLASQDGGLLEVYLIELRSVTVAITRAITQAFRNLSVLHPLLVLTDDYQRLDFVLVERFSAPSGDGQGFASPVPGLTSPGSLRVGVRPRVLTVSRLKPDAVALRVLRRFSFTESDSFAQEDKLLSAYEVAAWSEPFFNNRALFSDYYLTQRLPESPDWHDPGQTAAMTRAYRDLRDLYAGARERYASQPASVTRTKLLQPALSILGFTPRMLASTENSIVQPYSLLVAGQQAGTPLALCLAYNWGRALDGKDEQRDTETPDANPGAVVVSLLDRSSANQGATWAIVTNGKLWRLYSARAHSRATNYYEIDLEETLAQPPEHRELAFRYFWHFFRAAAFQPAERRAGGEVEGEPRPACFLDGLVSDSERYARELGERLKERVFFEIFPHFARGFIYHARRTGHLPPNLETLPSGEGDRLLDPFFSGTLTFLYRLLFLLYAESRDLLPVREARGYYERSLEKLKREIAEGAGPIEDQAPARIKAAYNELSTALYDRLQALFAAVDKGDPDLNVPVYNGGLFVIAPDPADPSPEAQVARFLATCKIPDRQLALGLDRMARDLDEKRHDLAFIDYKSLGVRQLGSIYEGLLEFRLRIAPQEMAVIKDKTEKYLPYAEAQQRKLTILKEGRGKDARDKIVPTGDVYLENDRRERKATGSYYTPDYIVKYIIEQTAGPVLQAKLEALRPIFREAEKTLRAEQEKMKALRREDISPEHETYKKFRVRLCEAFFDLRVLDPAMGSGHFLVEAVDYLTDRMADFLSAFRWNPVVYELAQTRREIQGEMERQRVSIDLGKLTDLNLLKRRVLKSCIYGVDLNPMAVELAKVSLWLDCFTLGAPLSFLDHHMKCGNSLIGGSVQEVQDALSQDLWGSQFSYLLDATQLMRKVGELSDVTAQQVATSRQAYQGAYDALAPFKRLLDVYTSDYFGNKGAKHKTRLYAGAIAANDYHRITNPEDRQAIADALTLAQSKRFFHWELEFPEVFFDESKRKENGGFDAVVGNPPYVRQEGLGDDKPAFKEMYEVYNSIADLYTYFIERGHTLLRSGGRFGMITANKFMRANYGAALREFLTTKVRLEKLIDFGELRVFDEAATDPLITVSSKSTPTSGVEYVQIKNLNFDLLDNVARDNAVRLSETSLSGSNWSLAVDTAQLILDKLNTHSIPLGNYVNGQIRRGILTGFNEAFVIDRTAHDRLLAEDPKSIEILKPFLIGDDIRRYGFDYRDRFLIWTYVGVPIDKYPAIYRHLEQYQAQLEKRWDKGNHWWELRHCDYYRDFEAPKIVYPVIAVNSRFTLDEEGYYSNDKTFLIPRNDRYLLALLNSILIWYCLKKICSVLGDADDGGRLELRSIHIGTMPIRRINFTLPPEQRAYYLDKAKLLYATCLEQDDRQCVLGFVDHHLAREPEESDVVHDLLAFLAEEMIRLNKQKRAAQREFLDWLVETLRILPDKDGRRGIDVLTGKAKLADYPGDYQKGEPPLAPDELLEMLRKNKGRLGVSLSDAALVERIGRVYEESLGRVLPLKEQLRQTDALIDAVVYRLYGLTEEEIRVVEGRG